MTGPDLIRLAEALAAAGGMHRLTSLVTAAVHVCLEHERRGRTAVESWEDGPCGAGMSDRVVREPKSGTGLQKADCDYARAAKMAKEAFGGICGGAEAETRPMGLKTGLASISTHSATNCAQRVNPAPLSPERGERLPLPMTERDHG